MKNNLSAGLNVFPNFPHRGPNRGINRNRNYLLDTEGKRRKAKPAVRRGRKATDLNEIAGLPGQKAGNRVTSGKGKLGFFILGNGHQNLREALKCTDLIEKMTVELVPGCLAYLEDGA